MDAVVAPIVEETRNAIHEMPHSVRRSLAIVEMRLDPKPEGEQLPPTPIEVVLDRIQELERMLDQQLEVNETLRESLRVSAERTTERDHRIDCLTHDLQDATRERDALRQALDAPKLISVAMSELGGEVAARDDGAVFEWVINRMSDGTPHWKARTPVPGTAAAILRDAMFDDSEETPL